MGETIGDLSAPRRDESWAPLPSRNSGIRRVSSRPPRTGTDAERFARTRAFTLAAIVGFGGSSVFDVLVCSIGGRGSLGAVLLLRAAALVPVVAAHVLARRASRADAQTVSYLTAFGVLAMTASVSAMTLLTGGFRSPYHASQMILAFLLAFRPMPWGKGAKVALRALGIHGAIAIGLPFVITDLASTCADLSARVHVVVFTLYVCAAWIVAVVISNALWTMRLEVVETREVTGAPGIDRYRVDRLLASGGMGEVWVAYDRTLAREVALKILSSESRAGPEAAALFESEVRATTKLTHPNSVRIYDYGVTADGSLFFAMELLDGEHLASLVAREGALPVRRAASLVLQAARALTEAHDLGIVHRDVKPENLFLQRTSDGEGCIKVLDFGIATSSATRATTSGAWAPPIVGTPSAASPEVIEGKRATPESDVYGLGVVLYLLTTGTLPFATDHAMATMLAHLTLEPQPPSERRGAPVPKSLEAIVLRCLAKNPDDRFADARALAEALDEAITEISTRPRAISTRARLPRHLGVQRRTSSRPRAPRDLVD